MDIDFAVPFKGSPEKGTYRKLLSEYQMCRGDVTVHGSIHQVVILWPTGIWGHILHKGCRGDAVIVSSLIPGIIGEHMDDDSHSPHCLLMNDDSTLK